MCKMGVSLLLSIENFGVDQETRSELLGHTSKTISEHYSMADINKLYEEANKIITPIKTQTIIRLKRKNARKTA